MPTDYNEISDDYKQSKQAPWRIHAELFTLLGLLGDVAGKNVLDLACGEGFLTREIKQQGAGRVVGVDLSSAMIELARAQEKARPLGIEYVVKDVESLELGAQFDLVSAGWLLNYARNRDEALAMCKSIARHLKPGGRFCSINNNSEDPPPDFAITRVHGFVRSEPRPIKEGDKVIWTFHLSDHAFTVENYYLKRATVVSAFEEAGMEDVKFHPPRLGPNAAEAGDDKFWAAFLDHAPAVFIEATKK